MTNLKDRQELENIKAELQEEFAYAMESLERRFVEIIERATYEREIKEKLEGTDLFTKSHLIYTKDQGIPDGTRVHGGCVQFYGGNSPRVSFGDTPPTELPSGRYRFILFALEVS